MLIDTMKKLCALSGVSGSEDAVREFIAAEAKPYATKMTIDNMGNLLVFKKGKKTPSKRIMLAAHMDEVGVIALAVTDGGCVKFDFVGGVDRRVALGQRVWFGSRMGVVGLKPIHLAKDSKEVPKLDELYIDVGAKNREEAEKLVSPGDIGTFDPETVEYGNGMLKAKAIDDRIGCAVLLELLKEELPVDVSFAFTAQEEVGTRGAQTAAFRIDPDVALIVEGTTAADLPSVEGTKKICSPGKGVVVPFMDRGTIYDRELWSLVTSLADTNGIKWQTKQMIAGGTDASAIQKARTGAKVVGIAAAIRNIHSPVSAASVADMEDMLKLARLFVGAQG